MNEEPKPYVALDITPADRHGKCQVRVDGEVVVPDLAEFFRGLYILSKNTLEPTETGFYSPWFTIYPPSIKPAIDPNKKEELFAPYAHDDIDDENDRLERTVAAERSAILQLIDAYRDELFAPGDWVGADQLKALDELARRIQARANQPDPKERRGLDRLKDALVADILNTGDEELLAEAAEDGVDVEGAAKRMRRAIKAAKERTLNWSAAKRDYARRVSGKHQPKDGQ